MNFKKGPEGWEIVGGKFSKLIVPGLENYIFRTLLDMRQYFIECKEWREYSENARDSDCTLFPYLAICTVGRPINNTIDASILKNTLVGLYGAVRWSTSCDTCQQGSSKL
ncbi:Hypothetical protein NTJ_16215 [Nesidiocoris tenuis]|uniref:Uncharacterized protein n=1 Tax=Nesidiocoris tenuis TaxID=355587 RepID=A0ABN7BIM0_9HEMI|nr:Hypothetical protein NTJ_16215 [Nesidiocoris tenuis]